MPVPLPNWLTRATEAIRQLADRPWTLFLLLLAFNAIARPCSSPSHDARLYTLQALNAAENGAYGDDVFLRFGSQDQFSIFSRVVGPCVATIGLRWTFFLFYFVFNTLFIAGLLRFVRALIDDRLISTLALVYLVTAPLAYGGYGIFMVHEQFFTPRLVGATFTLFALERLLRQAFVSAFALLAIGLAMHPLMAFGGVMIAVAHLAWTLLPTRVFVGITAAGLLSFAGLLCVPSIATAAFGAMDDEWHHSIRIAVGYNYPDTWPIKDWINLALSFALPIISIFTLFRADPSRQRFLGVVVLAGAVGFLTTLAASVLPYALLFQAQPYRVLWILQALQAPLAFLLIAHWSQSERLVERILALALFCFFCFVQHNTQELLIISMALPISFIVSLASEENKEPGWWWYTVARGFVLGAIGWTVYRWWFFINQREVVRQNLDLDELVMLDLVSPVLCIVLFCVAFGRWQWSSSAPSLRWGAVAASIVIPLGVFATEASATIRNQHSRLGSDIAFVAEFIDSQGRPSGCWSPRKNWREVYCSLGRPDLLWIDVGATSYFDILQTAGVMFNRATATEIDRRVLLVNKFEMARQRREEVFLSAERKVGMENLFKLSFTCPEPTREDLIRLCQEPGLDYVVVPHEFPGLYSATNGRIYIYECYKVKNATSSTEITPIHKEFSP